MSSSNVSSEPSWFHLHVQPDEPVEPLMQTGSFLPSVRRVAQVPAARLTRGAVTVDLL